MPLCIVWPQSVNGSNCTIPRLFWEEFHPRVSEILSETSRSGSPIPLFDDAAGDLDGTPDYGSDGCGVQPVNCTSSAGGGGVISKEPSKKGLLTRERIPAPYTDSGQLHEESPLQFLARRREMLRKRVANERLSQRQARLESITRAAKKLPPGKKGASVFEWLESIPGHLLRTRVNPDVVEHVWSAYSPQAKVYDSLKDEWDLWEGFGGDTEPDKALTEEILSQDSVGEGRKREEDVCYAWYYARLCSSSPMQSPGLVQAPRRYEEAPFGLSDSLPEIRSADGTSLLFKAYNRLFLQRVQIKDVEPSLQSHIWQRVDSSIVQNIQLRFGYCNDDANDADKKPTANTAFSKCLQKLYWHKSSTAFSAAVKWKIEKAIDGMENFCGELRSIPENFDVHDDNSEALAKLLNGPLRFEAKEVLATEGNRLDDPTRKRAKRIKRVYFVSQARTERQGAWAIAMDDPASVLECLRLRSGSLHELLRHIVVRGIPLHTAQSDGQADGRTSKLNKSSLPVRLPSNHVLNIDYLFCMQRATALLENNQRIARAALMRGGIVWRLAIEVAKVEDVLDGPSQESLSPVMDVVGRGGLGLETWYDDTLTSEEEDIICGVYRSSEVSGHESEQLWSFWPTPNVWDTSSVNAGYWTPYNEEWFLKRRKFLLSNEAFHSASSPRRLYYQREWRTMLQGQKKLGLRLVRKNQAIAETFLDAAMRRNGHSTIFGPGLENSTLIICASSCL